VRKYFFFNKDKKSDCLPTGGAKHQQGFLKTYSDDFWISIMEKNFQRL